MLKTRLKSLTAIDYFMKEYEPRINSDFDISEIREELQNQAKYLQEFSKHIGNLFETFNSRLDKLEKYLVLNSKANIPTENKKEYDENERIKDLTRYSLSLVTLEKATDGIGQCHNCTSYNMVKSVNVESKKIVYGTRCTSSQCKNRFYEQGSIPISLEINSHYEDVPF
jgi:hypothetical protein